MYPYAPTAERTREVWLDTISKVGNKVTSGKVQEATLLAFKSLHEISRNVIIPLCSSDEPAITPLQYLLPNIRVAQLFSMGIGICHVPVTGGKEQWGNARYVSNPEDPLFTAAEQAALRHIYNAKTLLKTGSTDRWDALNAAEFLIASVDAPQYTVKTRLLTASYTLVGGEPTHIELHMPQVGSMAALTDTDARKLFICIKSNIIAIVAESSASKDEVAAMLRGGK